MQGKNLVASSIKAPLRNRDAQGRAHGSRRVSSLLISLLTISIIAFVFVVARPKWQQYRLEQMTLTSLAREAAATSTAQPCIILGQRAVKAKRPQNAIEPLEACSRRAENGELKASDIEKARIAGLLGLARALTGQIDRSVPHFRRAIHLDFNTAPAHLAFALWLQAQGAEQVALNELEIVTQLEPRNAAAWYLKASIHNQSSELEPAREAAKRALELDPAEPLHWQAMGDSYGLGGRFAEALPYYRKELSLAPKSPAAQADVARVLALGAIEEEEFDEGVERLNSLINSRIVELGPAYSLLGQLYLRFNRPRESRTALDQAVEHDGAVAEHWYHLSMARKLSGDKSGSAIALERFKTMEEDFRRTRRLQKRLGENPDDADLHLALAQQWEKNGQNEAALREYRAVAYLRPSDPIARKRVASLSRFDTPEAQLPRNDAIARLLSSNAALKMSRRPHALQEDAR